MCFFFLIFVDVLANKSTRKFYSTEEKRQIYSWILQRNGTSTKMKRGVSAAVAELAKCPRRVVTRIWRQGLKGGGINNVKCMRKMKCGRKKINLDIEALQAIPTTERTTLRQLAENMNMPKTTIFRRYSHNHFHVLMYSTLCQNSHLYNILLLCV